MEPVAAPHMSSAFEIEKDWIDYNGHLNMAYYNVLFDRATDELWVKLGLGPEYARTRRLTTYTAEIHVCYVRELHLGDRVTASWQLLDHDEKRLHAFQGLYHSDGWLAATCESIALHVDMAGPKVAPFPPDIRERVERVWAAHAHLPRPERAGRAIGVRRRG
ncbi:thioesterase family protein [Chelativorans sp. M5D2P16]|uniref:thioesterase family protein n=1 Tax=Chelativorans sp. M5D2P16 TaxID=3095678 RepID=UPI002ACA7C4A|nr:thioesterase family protein [Chelativorans sp. M5D2P16]MDZ5698188.1 thioesterase family protein [Chelativorans sp. M5D2P16]